MADGSKQVGAQLLVFGEYGGLLPLPRRLVALEGECALADDRQDDGVLERLELAPLQVDAHDAEYLVARAHRKVEALRLWQGVSARPGVLVVVESPRRHGSLVFGEQGRAVVFGPGALIQRLPEQVAVCGVEDDVEPEELHELAHGDARSCLGSLGPLQELVGFEEHAGSEGVFRRGARVVGEARGEFGGHHCGCEHDDEGHEVASVVAVE